jgi:hypothetical protein
MKRPADTSRPDPASLNRKADELRSLLRNELPQILAEKTGCPYTPETGERGSFNIPVWGGKINLSFPELVASSPQYGGSAPPHIELLLLYYFATADGTPITGQWVSFADLPGGRFYNQAFQGYTGKELAKTFQSDREAFTQAATRSGGQVDPGAPGDLAFRFQALPQVPVLLVYWEGDEDFPPSYQVLFDASARHYLPTDAFAILGSGLTSRMKKNLHKNNA